MTEGHTIPAEGGTYLWFRKLQPIRKYHVGMNSEDWATWSLLVGFSVSFNRSSKLRDWLTGIVALDTSLKSVLKKSLSQIKKRKLTAKYRYAVYIFFKLSYLAAAILASILSTLLSLADSSPYFTWYSQWCKFGSASRMRIRIPKAKKVQNEVSY